MLVLTRKRNESIKIGNDIVIKVIQTSRGTVKLGIEAPAHVRVLRAELAEFAPVSVEVTAVGEEQHLVEVDAIGDTDPTIEDDCYFTFTTDFAMEIEEQMMCVATD